MVQGDVEGGWLGSRKWIEGHLACIGDERHKIDRDGRVVQLVFVVAVGGLKDNLQYQC